MPYVDRRSPKGINRTRFKPETKVNAFKDWKESDVNAHNNRVAMVGNSANGTVANPVQPVFALEPTRPSYTITLPFPPSANAYNQQRVVVPRNPNKKPFVMFYPSSEAKEFREKVATLVRHAGVPLLKGSVLVVLKFYRPRKAVDLDNRNKVILDALNGVAYADDEQITRIESERFDDRDNPRAEVTIQERI